ncbi:hypothetical protein DSECCO2_86120 [anaerobic digester metagenome]
MEKEIKYRWIPDFNTNIFKEIHQIFETLRDSTGNCLNEKIQVMGPGRLVIEMKKIQGFQSLFYCQVATEFRFRKSLSRDEIFSIFIFLLCLTGDSCTSGFNCYTNYSFSKMDGFFSHLNKNVL